jgi:nucleoporin NDC1
MIKDVDKVTSRKAIVDKNKKLTSAVDPPLIQIKRALPSIAKNAGLVAAAAFPGILLYLATPMRGIAWGWGYWFLKKFYTLTPGQELHKSGIAPFPDFTFRLVTEVFLLVFLWEVTNTAYSAYISQEPLKKGKPLTDDSKDPNGSLIVGLKANKQFAKATAFWELSMITSRFPARRQTIYDELDRTGGSTFTQILALSLAQVSAINSRIAAYTAKSAPPPPPPAIPENTLGRAPQAAPLRTDPIFAKGGPKPTLATSLAKQYGNSPGAKPLQNALDYGSKKLLTSAQREKLQKQPAVVEQKVEGLWMKVVKSPAGWLLRKPFSRLATSVVCGTPYSESGVIVDAVQAVTVLAREALREDKYARVSREIPSILLTLTSAIKSIEAFLGSLEPHHSDIFFTQGSRKEVEEVNEVLIALKDAVGALFGVYGEYLPGLGMSDGQIGEIKAVANVPRKDKGKQKVVEMEKI